MTKEEARKQIEAFRTCMIVDDAEPYVVEALNMAIEALEQESCEDCVSRAEVLNYIKSSKEWLYRNENFDVEMQTSFEDIEMAIKDLPVVRPKQKMEV